MRAVNVAGGPVIVRLDVASFRPTQALQRLAERRNTRLCLRIALGKAHEHADPSHPGGLLRVCCERPRRCAAEEECDEFPPPHGAYPKAKDQKLIIAPCIAAKSGPSCPERVNRVGSILRPRSRHDCFAPKADK